MKFDVVIPYCEKDEYTIYSCIDSLKNISEINNIYVVSSKEFTYKNIRWVNEDIFPFKKGDITRLNSSILLERAGWYYQQLIKLHSFLIPNIADSFLILDSDVIFLRDVNFFENNKFKYNYSHEYTLPYFECMYRLNNFFTKSTDISGICHHMIFEKKILDEIFDLIKQPGEEVYETIIKAVTHKEIGFSEYELYFNYIFKKYPEFYTIRHLNYADVTDYKLYLQNNNYDYIANHAWRRLQ